MRSISALRSAGVYCAFAAAVFLAHGSTPELSADHITYLKSANEIMVANPDGFYARNLTSLTSYAVLLAYLHEWTHSHILSLKWILAVVTVFYLFSTEAFFRPLTTEAWKAVLFSVLAAFFVTFGAPVWGVTDFAASLNRTIVVPFMIAIVGGFMAFHDRPWKYLAYPVLIALSLLHLSVYYLVLTLLVYEAWDFVIERKMKIDRRLAWFALGLLLAFSLNRLIEAAGMGAFGQVGYTLKHAVTQNEIAPAEAWSLELYANPWRNMPLPLTTLATIGASFGLIGLAALTGLGITVRRGLTQLDRRMIGFGIAVLAASYGLQTLMWLARNLAPIYPVNFEEMRAITFIMLPALYFVFRLFESKVAGASPARKIAVSAAVSALVLLQPIVVLRSLPEQTREAVVQLAVQQGLIRRDDALRTAYARQFLALPERGPRFYYSVQGVAGWLDAHAAKGDRVVSDRNDLLLANVEVIGAFNSLQNKGAATRALRQWREAVRDVYRAFGSADLNEVERIGRKYGAAYAVVPWTVPGAVYQDRYFSVVQVPAGTPRTL